MDSVPRNGADEAGPLVHRGIHPMTVPGHQNNVIMKVGSFPLYFVLPTFMMTSFWCSGGVMG